MTEEMLDRIPIESTINEIEQTIPIREYLEQLDKDFTYILLSIIKKIKGLRQGVPFSKQKVQKYTVL